MKLWKRTVLLMLVTLLCALIPVDALSIYVTGNRSLNNAAETYGRQLENGKTLLEQFWDNSKYEQMSETGKKAYMGFQFQRCCGAGMALIDKKSNAAIENLTDYEVVGIENLGLKNENDPYAYKIQKLGKKYLLLQKVVLFKPEGYDVLSVREVTGLFNMTLASNEKKEREERFQNYIKAGSRKVSEKEAKDKVTSLVSGDWEIFESSSKELTEGNTTLEKDDFIFQRMIDGISVNYVRDTSLSVNEQALEWENEDGTLHEGQSEGWENEVLTMDFCSGTIQSFLHRNPIEASNVSDEGLFLLPFDEVKDIFEKTITLQVMTEDKNRMIVVDGGSNYRYPSIDAQSAEITITKVQLGYMRMPDSEDSDTEAVLIPVWDFYGTWTSEEPEYEYGNGEDGLVMGDVTMDDAGVPLLTIDARDGSVIQRIQAGWSVSTGDN